MDCPVMLVGSSHGFNWDEIQRTGRGKRRGDCTCVGPQVLYRMSRRHRVVHNYTSITRQIQLSGVWQTSVSTPKAALQPPRIDGTHKRHPDASALRVLILLHLNPHLDLVKHRNCHWCPVLSRVRRRWYHDGIVVRIELHVAFEHDETFQSESKRHISEAVTQHQKLTYWNTNTPTPFRNVRMTNASSVMPSLSAFPGLCSLASASARPLSASPT